MRTIHFSYIFSSMKIVGATGHFYSSFKSVAATVLGGLWVLECAWQSTETNLARFRDLSVHPDRRNFRDLSVHTDRRTDRRRTDRRTDGQTDMARSTRLAGQTDGQTDRKTDGHG